MRSPILNRSNSNDLGNRRDRRVVAVKNGLRGKLRACISFFRQAISALAGILALIERSRMPGPGVLAVQGDLLDPDTAVTIRLGAAYMPSLASFGPQRRWHSMHRVRQASARIG